jgi:NADH-quinone oxidoreductase subunit H
MAETVSWSLIVLLFITGIYLVAVMERWAFLGRWELSGPFKSLFSYFIQEDIRPHQRDKIFYETAPVLFITAAFLAAVILPFGKEYVIIDFGTGALFLNAALAYIMVSVLMAGWAHNSVYALIGGWRFLAQLIAYSMPVVMSITAAVMRSESMLLSKIVLSQEPLWNILYQPVGFLLFYLASMALAFLPPFDLPNAPGNLAGGVLAEYTGKRLMVIRLGRLVLVLTLSIAITVLFLGGWYGPLLPGFVWVFLKTFIVATSFFVAGRYIPRIRHDHLLEWSWKYATPAALFNILWVGILLLI